MAVHICRAFAVQSSQLFAAIREVNHNTCYGVETRRGHVDSAGGGVGLGALHSVHHAPEGKG